MRLVKSVLPIPIPFSIARNAMQLEPHILPLNMLRPNALPTPTRLATTSLQSPLAHLFRRIYSVVPVHTHAHARTRTRTRHTPQSLPSMRAFEGREYTSRRDAFRDIAEQWAATHVGARRRPGGPAAVVAAAADKAAPPPARRPAFLHRRRCQGCRRSSG